MYSLFSYVQFLWQAQGAFLLHSPFVFSFYTKVIRGKKSRVGHQIEHFRKELERSDVPIDVEDFGAGHANQGGGTYTAPLGQLARKAARKRKVGELLYRLCQHFQPKRCLELGTHLGISALYQLSGLGSDSQFISMEGSASLAELARQHWDSFNLKGEVLVGEFDVLFDKQFDLEAYRPDYVFVDGNHRYEPTVRYAKLLIPQMEEGGILIFDDIYWSKGMTNAWEEIIQWPEISVSLDLFHLGICFVKRPQAKEHFRLRM